jgi:hypothetical protein
MSREPCRSSTRGFRLALPRAMTAPFDFRSTHGQCVEKGNLRNPVRSSLAAQSFRRYEHEQQLMGALGNKTVLKTGNPDAQGISFIGTLQCFGNVTLIARIRHSDGNIPGGCQLSGSELLDRVDEGKSFKTYREKVERRQLRHMGGSPCPEQIEMFAAGDRIGDGVKPRTIYSRQSIADSLGAVGKDVIQHRAFPGKFAGMAKRYEVGRELTSKHLFHLAQTSITDSLTKAHHRRFAGAAQIADLSCVNVEKFGRVKHDEMRDPRMVFRQ